MAKNNEQWRPIPGYGGMYEVSKHGEIRSWRVNGSTHEPTERAAEPRMLSPVLRKRKGHGMILEISLWNGRQKSQPINVKNLVRDIWLGGPKPGLRVQLIDGDPAHCSVYNMRFVTPAEINKTKSSSMRRPVSKRRGCEIIEFYRSVQEAAKRNHLSVSGMRYRLKRRSVVDGIYFEYAD